MSELNCCWLEIFQKIWKFNSNKCDTWVVCVVFYLNLFFGRFFFVFGFNFEYCSFLSFFAVRKRKVYKLMARWYFFQQITWIIVFFLLSFCLHKTADRYQWIVYACKCVCVCEFVCTTIYAIRLCVIFDACQYYLGTRNNK